MLRQVIPVITQATEIDDPPNAGVSRRRAEILGRRRVLAGEVRLAERVDQVKGGFTAVHRGQQRASVTDVAEHWLTSALVAVRIPRHRHHLAALRDQCDSEPTTYKPGSPGDENSN